ncbi:MAG: hypothetical protein ACRET2_08165 [Steroidobacteraceae bacterium]
MAANVMLAVSRYVQAQKAMTKHDRELTKTERTVLDGRLAKAEKELLAAVGALIGAKVERAKVK